MEIYSNRNDFNSQVINQNASRIACFVSAHIAGVLSSYIFLKLSQLLHTQHDALRCNMSGENEKHMFYQHLVSSIHGFPKNTVLRIKISQQLDWDADFPCLLKFY